MNWMLEPYRRYADFSGRSRRLEFWMFQLFQWLVMVGAIILAAVLGAASGSAGSSTDMPAGFGIAFGLIGLFAVASFIPGLAVTVRRLHDSDKSGWWILISLVPLGGIVMLVFTLLDGTPGDNQYGPDPKGSFDPATFR